MKPDVRGIMAAPNRARITAKVLGVEQSEKYPDKWHLRLEVLESSDIDGPNFARVGQNIEGFTFGSTWEASPPAIIEAEVEYIGDARGGQFQLSDVHTAGE